MGSLTASAVVLLRSQSLCKCWVDDRVMRFQRAEAGPSWVNRLPHCAARFANPCLQELVASSSDGLFW